MGHALVYDLVRRSPRERRVLEQDPSPPRHEQPRDRLDRRRLARPIRSQHRDDFTRGNGERHALQRVNLPVIHMQILDD